MSNLIDTIMSLPPSVPLVIAVLAQVSTVSLHFYLKDFDKVLYDATMLVLLGLALFSVL